MKIFEINIWVFLDVFPNTCIVERNQMEYVFDQWMHRLSGQKTIA